VFILLSNFNESKLRHPAFAGNFLRHFNFPAIVAAILAFRLSLSSPFLDRAGPIFDLSMITTGFSKKGNKRPGS
jgi:hypothetical protein